MSMPNLPKWVNQALASLVVAAIIGLVVWMRTTQADVRENKVRQESHAKQPAHPQALKALSEVTSELARQSEQIKALSAGQKEQRQLLLRVLERLPRVP